MVKGWSEQERAQLRRDVPTMGLQTPFRDGTLQDVAKQALAISRAGLNARARLNSHGENETVFLQELDNFAQTGKNNADRLIESYKGKWDGDITHAYRDCAF